MKYSLALISALATVSLAGPVETEQGKKPFIDPLYNAFGPKCLADNAEFPRDSEACLGTRDYCGWKKYEAMGEHFDSPKSCMDSRQPPPFKEPASEENQPNFCEGNLSFAGDSWRATTEPCLGTVAYCNKKAYEGTGETYDNPDECINLRLKTLIKNASFFQPLLDKILELHSAKAQQALIDAIPKCRIDYGPVMERRSVEITCPMYVPGTGITKYNYNPVRENDDLNAGEDKKKPFSESVSHCEYDGNAEGKQHPDWRIWMEQTCLSGSNLGLQVA